MAKIDRVQEVSTELLKPYERNAKVHTDDQVKKIADSINEFGFLNPCLIDKENRIIAGHGRVLAAKMLGMETVPCVYLEGLTEAQRRAYILADNKLTELGEWNRDLVSDELDWLKQEGFDIDLTGFNIDDISFDEIEDIPHKINEEDFQSTTPKVKYGDIWLLGDHRLMCGDSTNIEDVLRLMGGCKADLLETDPPYNVDVSNEVGLKIANDNMDDDSFYQFLCDAFRCANACMKEGASFYIWHADINGLIFRSACEDSGLHIRQNLIWVKNNFTLGRQDYQWKHEPCLYGWTEGGGHYFINLRSMSTVQEYDSLGDKSKEELIEIINQITEECGTVVHENKPQVSELHPTMKPISLIKKHIRNSSREGEIVLDLFGGSGTTLIACEDMQRKCFLMEFDPYYADVIVKRWEEHTGKKAELL